MNSERLARTLLESFQEVPDPRSVHGRRHQLAAILTLATAAMRSGARSLYAIAPWGREQPVEVVIALGFVRRPPPAVATLHRVFRRLDVERFELVLQAWAQANLGDEGGTIAIDGKGLRGIHGEELPGVRLVAAYSDAPGLVLAQKGGQERNA